MNVQRHLNALLFELQTAQSPLAQAKILARSWRTLRELSPTDRRLLARHAGFDGAEQILEGLATKKKGFAPGALLELLNRARATDGAAVGELLTSLRDPSRFDEAVTRGAEITAELLGQDEDGGDPEAISSALDQLHLVEQAVRETPEEALAALNALETETVHPEIAAPLPPRPKDARDAAPDQGSNRVPENSKSRPVETKPARTVPKETPRVARQTHQRVAPVAGWDHLGEKTEPKKAFLPESSDDVGKNPTAPGASRFDATKVFAALGAEGSSFSRLRVLDREMMGFRGSSPATIRELLNTLPDGWVRRRALVALINAGIPSAASQAVDLIADFEREVDRQWCLGALARRGDLKGPEMERALDLVASPSARRRLQTTVARS